MENKRAGEKPVKLTEPQIEERLMSLSGWSRKDEKWIEKKFRFKEFLDGIEFVNQVAHLAEQMVHHPMISIDYKLITLRLTTWNEGGLTELDMESAREFDALYKKYRSA
ncbi:4a-hydroxytetrahydrobiopterin dehydratase [Aneurinibacillus sp. REN35]|uniref:4a-hydroxytetrahydrobiopterin dehydratase n=1 Tax=Aneurinibacillus sp. REN35 TaxID=3237286 RepID=UPI0035290A9D